MHLDSALVDRHECGLEVATGPGVPVSSERFDGRLIDAEVRLGVRARRRFAAVWQLMANAGAALQFTWIDGSVLPEGLHVQSLRVAVPLRVELEADWLIGRAIRVGLRAGIASSFHDRNYLVAGEPVLTLSATTFESALVLGVSLPD
jgi:hypothetical protein